MATILTQKQQRDRAIYDEYNKLIEEGHPRTGVVQHLMHKHRIYSPMTIYRIVKRISEKETEAQHETV